ncbi:hypothetical protein CR513_25465, partial [Mucuna pruriens]
MDKDMPQVPWELDDNEFLFKTRERTFKMLLEPFLQSPLVVGPSKVVIFIEFDLKFGACDMNLGRLGELGKGTHEDLEHMEVKALQDPMTRGRLRRLEEEVHQKMGLLMRQGRPNQGLTLFTLWAITMRLLAFWTWPKDLSLVVCDLKVQFLSECLRKERMGENINDLESYSPKTRQVMRHMRSLKEKLEKLGGGLEPIRIDTQSFNAKVDALSKGDGNVHQNLKCFDYDERAKVRLVTLEFGGNALLWWNKLTYNIRTMRRALIENWHELRRELRDRFIPSFYSKDMHNKLQRLYQRSKSVKEYFKEMEVTLIRAQVVESQEVTMTRFLHSLNREV